MFPGSVKQFTGSRYVKDADGNLRVIGFFTDTMGLLPGTHYSDVLN